MMFSSKYLFVLTMMVVSTFSRADYSTGAMPRFLMEDGNHTMMGDGNHTDAHEDCHCEDNKVHCDGEHEWEEGMYCIWDYSCCSKRIHCKQNRPELELA
mmetsp:Transcript_15622/g.33767  ORF Transcript_15622/g.33767 Transcript_15622/m.33767 type:complete len:99 (+) Transcript_15622:292-588(+)